MSNYDRDKQSYTWLPGFLRRFLNLEYDEPRGTGQGASYSRQPDFTPSSPGPSQSWRESSQPSFTPSNTGSPRPAAFAPPPAPAPRPNGLPSITPGANLPPIQTEGYVQPVTHLLRAYARGALPPQGLENFTKEVRGTSTDVWNFYSYWLNFQTEDLFRFGRELLNTVAGAPAGGSSTSSAAAPTARRIKVTVGNGPDTAAEVGIVPIVSPAPSTAEPPTLPAAVLDTPPAPIVTELPKDNV